MPPHARHRSLDPQGAAGALTGAMAGLAGIVAPAAVAAALVPVRRSFASPAAALVLVAVVAGVAILGNRVAGVLASLSSGLAFDFFLTRPYERLAISHRGDLETTVSLVVVGIVVTELAAWGRHYRRAAAEEADHVALISALADMVAQGVPAAPVVERAGAELVDLLHLRAWRYETGKAPAGRPTVLAHGDVVHAGVLWGVATMGLPGPEVDLPVHHGGRSFGRFVLEPSPGRPVPPERVLVAVAVAAQAGAALAGRARIA